MGERVKTPGEFGPAIDLATARTRLLDAPARAGEIGAEWDGDAFILRYLGSTARVVQATGECTLDGRRAPGADMLLLLHYITGARSFHLENRWLSFRELPDGRPYLAAFLERGPQRIAAGFNGDPGRFARAATRFAGGRPAPDLPGLAYVIPALPLLPLAVLLHEGDSSLPASANILFNAGAPLHFHTEDLAVLGERFAQRLVDWA